NVDPFDSRLDDPLERERLLRLFTRGLDRVAAYVLPVARDDESGWRTGAWFLRSERCYLVPGDSPAGFRLPLDSPPGVTPTDYPYVYPPDPMRPVPTLRRYAEIRRQLSESAP